MKQLPNLQEILEGKRRRSKQFQNCSWVGDFPPSMYEDNEIQQIETVLTKNAILSSVLESIANELKKPNPSLENIKKMIEVI